MVMVHGDDKGLVLPPRIAPVQVVVVWIIKAKMAPAETEAIRKMCQEIGSVLRAAGVRVEVDDRDDKTSAWKFNYWELRGDASVLTYHAAYAYCKHLEMVSHMRR